MENKRMYNKGMEERMAFLEAGHMIKGPEFVLQHGELFLHLYLR